MRNLLKLPLAVLILGLGCATFSARATTVQFQTVMGDFEVNLFDNITPETVDNFLAYVEAGDYTNTFFHRSVPGFVVQGGGFFYDYDEKKAFSIAANDPVNNEPLLSNQRGTIAMARTDDPNSATSQWFFNLTNNSSRLDGLQGGFTVFGQVSGNGMAIIDAIADLQRFDFGGVYEELPLRNYTSEDGSNGVPLTHEHLVMIQNIVVLDPSPDTADGLNPKPTTRDDNGGGSGGGNDGGGSGGGGSFGLGFLLLIAAGLLLRRLASPGGLVADKQSVATNP